MYLYNRQISYIRKIFTKCFLMNCLRKDLGPSPPPKKKMLCFRQHVIPWAMIPSPSGVHVGIFFRPTLPIQSAWLVQMQDLHRSRPVKCFVMGSMDEMWCRALDDGVAAPYRRCGELVSLAACLELESAYRYTVVGPMFLSAAFFKRGNIKRFLKHEILLRIKQNKTCIGHKTIFLPPRF